MGGSVTINKATVKNAEIQKVIIVAKKQLHQHCYFNPPALFLASIKAGNVSSTAEQSQESMFSFFPSTRQRGLGNPKKKKDTHTHKKKVSPSLFCSLSC